MRSTIAAIVFTWIALHTAAQESATLERIDAFVAQQVSESGIPGVAIAVLQHGGAPHVRGFGHDGRGNSITGDTPFPIGSLTKSFTALLVQQLIEAGQLDADAPVQHYLPWFRVADEKASKRITIRHLLNQTSGFSRADGLTPLLQQSQASIQQSTRDLVGVSLNRPVGTRFEYSNLNFIVLGAVLEAITQRPWADLARERVMLPLGMHRTVTDYGAASAIGMTRLHRYWFGLPIAYDQRTLPGYAPTGNIVSTANDMSRYLVMVLAGGATPASAPIVSEAGVRQLLTAASPPAHSRLLSADFDFRYGEGWFVGPFGAASDARWHLGALPSFAAWMIVLPDTQQAVVVLINANCELPVGEVNAVFSRIPTGIVNLLRGKPPPVGPGIRHAYAPFNAVVATGLLLLLAVAGWAWRRSRRIAATSMAIAALLLAAVPFALGLTPVMLAQFAPDLALAGAIAILLLCLPLIGRLLRRPLQARKRALNHV